MKDESHARNILVLWKYSEAEDQEGNECYSSIGSQMKGIRIGDTLFVCATRDNELFLLGSINIERIGAARGRESEIGSHRAVGTNASGPFRIIPLGSAKWQLRFDSQSDRLSPAAAVSSQVQSRRFLTPRSAEILEKILKKECRVKSVQQNEFEREGRRMQMGLSRRERDPRVRRSALHHYGRTCMVCKIAFEDKYGRFARDCVQVHHLRPLGGRAGRGGRTKLKDVIVVCPNCHYALHASEDAANWRKLKRIIMSRRPRPK